jgi:hypothetical protein
MTTLTCAQAQSILQSTVVDVDSRIRAQSHLVTCEACGAASDSQVAQVHDVVQRHAEGKLWIRVSLAFLGVIQLSLALPWLMGHNSWWHFNQSAAQLHLARDGAIAMVFTMAAFLSARWRRLAWFCAVPTSFALLIQGMAALYDDSNGHIAFNFERIHLIGVAILVLILLEIRPVRARS